MTKLDFSTINKSSSKSFNDQRNVIKKLGRGEVVLCHTCQQPLALSVATGEQIGVDCPKGCTRIGLELDD